MHFTDIAIIGAGNMGASLLHGLLARGFPPEKITVADPSTLRLKELESKNIHVTEDNRLAILHAKVILFAIKPAMMESVITSLADVIQKNKPLLISIAAGIREESIAKYVGKPNAIVRCMPNTPAMIGCAATALYANSEVSADEKNIAETLLRSVGITVWIQDEKLMDAVTALSGSGPAYIFLVIEALQKAGEQMGLSAETSRLLTLQTAYGASRMALESNHDVEELRKQVTSPQGTTEAAIRTLEKENIFDIFEKALLAAKRRGEELGSMKNNG